MLDGRRCGHPTPPPVRTQRALFTHWAHDKIIDSLVGAKLVNEQRLRLGLDTWQQTP